MRQPTHDVERSNVGVLPSVAHGQAFGLVPPPGASSPGATAVSSLPWGRLRAAFFYMILSYCVKQAPEIF
jgi:hypothetical protein